MQPLAQLDIILEGGVSLPLYPGLYDVGRGSLCKVRLMDRSVSRRHAHLLVETGVATLTDCASTNGTFIAGQKIGQCVLENKTQIHFGKILCQFVWLSHDTLADEGSTANQQDNSLTPTERRVYILLQSEETEPQIAKQLCISPHTVHNHIKSIYRKLQVHSRLELLIKAKNNESLK